MLVAATEDKEGNFKIFSNNRPYNKFHKNVLKVPTLRNINLTAPYFHDASASTLEDAIKTMAKHNLGIQLLEEEITNLTLFLKTLEGETPTILESK